MASLPPAIIAEIQATQPSERKVQKYREVIQDFVRSENVDGLKAMADHLLTGDVPILISRSVLTMYATELSTLPNNEAYREVAEHAISRGHAHTQAFEEAEIILRERLFDVLKNEHCYREAASALAGLNLDSTARVFQPSEKAEIYIKVAETFLHADEAVDAEAFVNRASSMMEHVTDWTVQLRYRVIYARVMDANRKFLEAAKRYHELSQTQRKEIPAHELLSLLGDAVTCAILGKAGPQRSRILDLMHKDERLASLLTMEGLEGHPKVLEKMYMERLLTKKDIEGFEQSLKEHQKVILADGFTIPEKAMIEHNMVAASKVYDNVKFVELGKLLGIEAVQAEKVAARMIGEGRLKGSMDQVDGILQFDTDSDPLLSWDDRIESVCKSVNLCVEMVERAFPQLIES